MPDEDLKAGPLVAVPDERDLAVSQSIDMRRNALSAATLLAIATVLVALQLTGGRAGAAPVAVAAKSVTMQTKTFRLSRPDEKQRLGVGCPGRTWPLGGGMTSNPPPGRDGEGAYPHSYERLGVQQGWHTTAVLFDPTPASTQARDVTLQVACGRRRGHVTPPHKTVYVHPGQTRTAIASCPGRRHLFSGGFQRTDFITTGGNFITSSHAISGKSWAVTGHAFGQFGGELTAIAYCLRAKHELLSEVSASTTVASSNLATATTPTCPPGRRLTAGGFSTFPSGAALFTNGMINPDGSWSASAYGYFGPAANLTAYGYCLRG
jgi:hypothetical protein